MLSVKEKLRQKEKDIEEKDKRIAYLQNQINETSKMKSSSSELLEMTEREQQLILLQNELAQLKDELNFKQKQVNSLKEINSDYEKQIKFKGLP